MEVLPVEITSLILFYCRKDIVVVCHLWSKLKRKENVILRCSQEDMVTYNDRWKPNKMTWYERRLATIEKIDPKNALILINIRVSGMFFCEFPPLCPQCVSLKVSPRYFYPLPRRKCNIVVDPNVFICCHLHSQWCYVENVDAQFR